MTSEITQYTPPPSIGEIETIRAVADQISRTSMVPNSFRGKPDDVLAAALYGREIGLGMMAALQRIIVINGKPTLDAQGMLAMIRRHGHSVTGTSDSQRAVAKGKRSDTGDEMEVEFTIQMAKNAGLVKGGPWTQYPHAMLWARAVTQLARQLFPDVLSGFSYTAEEIGGEVQEEDLQPEIPVPSGPPSATATLVAEGIERSGERRLTAVPDEPKGKQADYVMYDEVVDGEVVEDHGLTVEDVPPRKPAALNKSFFAAWKMLMKELDCDTELEHACLEAIYGDKARGEDGYSIKHLDPDLARALLKALKEGNDQQSADEKQTAFLNRGVALMAEREGEQ